MFSNRNLITALDQHNTAVFLKDVYGRYLSMNSTGLNLMKEGHARVLGKTSHELFDAVDAMKMIESDQYVMRSGRVHLTEFTAKDRVTGNLLPMVNAKTAVVSPSGLPMGVVGISLVGYKNAALFSEACRLLPQFVQAKYPHLLAELLQLRTVADFLKPYQRH